MAIGAMKTGKAPSLDGYTIQYCNTFLPIIGPGMVAFFNAVGAEVTFLRDTLKAHISLILKEVKDSTSCGSYRPISLLNIDCFPKFWQPDWHNISRP